MKKFLFALSAVLLAGAITQAQPTKPTKISGMASNLPAGTFVKAGKIMVSNGYKAVYAPDSSVLHIVEAKSGTVSGSFTCSCNNGSNTAEGSCNLMSGPTGAWCENGKGCTGVCNMYLTINPKAGMATRRNSAGLTWLKLDLNNPPPPPTRQ